MYESVRFLDRLNFVSPYGRLAYELGKNREVQLKYASGVPHSAMSPHARESGGSLRRELVGGNLAAAAARNGWAGVVVDGCVRDAAELAHCEVGIRALALMPLPPEKRNEGQRDVPVQVQGVRVRPGDWLYADEDGIVVMATQA